MRLTVVRKAFHIVMGYETGSNGGRREQGHVSPSLRKLAIPRKTMYNYRLRTSG
jgi:hypothetical protein